MNKIVPVEPVKTTLLGARNDIESQVINAANQTEAPVLDSTMPKKIGFSFGRNHPRTFVTIETRKRTIN